MNITVSVIIPTYNRKQRLYETIQSVLNQTYQDFEILICDDGSTDDTKTMITSFSDERIKWLPGKNTGSPAIPRNRGIKNAKGQWLAFLDSDDLWELNKLERQMQVIQEKKINAVCTDAKILINDTIIKNTYFDFNEDKVYKFDDLLNINFVICSSMMVKREYIEQLKGFPILQIAQDYAMWFSLSMMTDIFYINDPLVIYRDGQSDSVRITNAINENKKYRLVILKVMSRLQFIKNKKQIYFFKLAFAFIISYFKDIKMIIKSFIR